MGGSGVLETGRPILVSGLSADFSVEDGLALSERVASRADRGGVFVTRGEFEIAREILDGGQDAVETFEEKAAIPVFGARVWSQ